MRKTLKMALAGAAAVMVALGTALPASAAEQTYYGQDCYVKLENSRSTDIAKTTANGGVCGVGDIRHYYSTSGWVGWSRWYQRDNANYAHTPALAELSKSEHKFVIQGTQRDVILPG